MVIKNKNVACTFIMILFIQIIKFIYFFCHLWRTNFPTKYPENNIPIAKNAGEYYFSLKNP